MNIREKQNGFILHAYDYIESAVRHGDDFATIETDLEIMIYQALDGYKFDNDIED